MGAARIAATLGVALVASIALPIAAAAQPAPQLVVRVPHGPSVAAVTIARPDGTCEERCRGALEAVRGVVVDEDTAWPGGHLVSCAIAAWPAAAGRHRVVVDRRDGRSLGGAFELPADTLGVTIDVGDESIGVQIDRPPPPALVVETSGGAWRLRNGSSRTIAIEAVDGHWLVPRLEVLDADRVWRWESTFVDILGDSHELLLRPGETIAVGSSSERIAWAAHGRGAQQRMVLRIPLGAQETTETVRVREHWLLTAPLPGRAGVHP